MQLLIDWQLLSETKAQRLAIALCFPFVLQRLLWAVWLPSPFSCTRFRTGRVRNTRCMQIRSSRMFKYCWFVGLKFEGERRADFIVRHMFMPVVQNCSVRLKPACLGSMQRYVYDQLNRTWILVLWSRRKLQHVCWCLCVCIQSISIKWSNEQFWLPLPWTKMTDNC